MYAFIKTLFEMHCILACFTIAKHCLKYQWQGFPIIKSPWLVQIINCFKRILRFDLTLIFKNLHKMLLLQISQWLGHIQNLHELFDMIKRTSDMIRILHGEVLEVINEAARLCHERADHLRRHRRSLLQSFDEKSDFKYIMHRASMTHQKYWSGICLNIFV